MTNLFLFAYPQDIFFTMPFKWADEKIVTLGDAIDKRYRAQGWQVGFVTYDNWGIAARLPRSASDLHITDGQEVYDDKKEGVIKRIFDDQPAWPTPERIIAKLPRVQKLRVGGFHEGSCVEMIAKAAYDSGIDTMVDEALTNLYLAIKPEDNFDANSFPGFDRCRTFRDDLMFKYFQERREGKPWLYDWSKHPQ